MESDLAALADLVIIVVESPGTFAELGAFSLADPLRKKLLPIVDLQYKDQQSFISTGPLRWIDQESEYRPTIYVLLSQVLQAIDLVEERIGRIPKGKTTRISDLSGSPKHLLFFLCDLIGVIHPALIETIEYYIDAWCLLRHPALRISVCYWASVWQWDCSETEPSLLMGCLVHSFLP